MSVLHWTNVLSFPTCSHRVGLVLVHCVNKIQFLNFASESAASSSTLIYMAIRKVFAAVL